MTLYPVRDIIAICKYTHVAFCVKGSHFLVCVRNEQVCPLCSDPHICDQ